ncbi:MAG TPA: hypothetical protein VGM09_25850 [Bradyrhizobium sp.]
MEKVEILSRTAIVRNILPLIMPTRSYTPDHACAIPGEPIADRARSRIACRIANA